MAQAQGSSSQIVIQEETTFKTDPVTPNVYRIHFISESLRYSRGLETSETIQANRNPGAPARLDSDVAGDITVELQAYIGLLLKGLFGSVTTSGASSPYTHTFKIGSSLPSFVVEKGFTDLGHYFKYNGVKVNRCSFDITRAGFQRMAFGLLGAKETVGTDPFDATPTDLGKKSFDGFAIATLEEGGSAIANVTAITGLTIENDLDPDSYVLGGLGERVSLPAGRVKVTGTITALFENLTLYNKAKNNTESSLKVVFNLGTGAGTAGNESLEFKISELIYSPNAPVISGPRGVLVEQPFEAYYDDGAEATSIQCILKSSQAAI
jgi:hypothetical protein